LDTTSQGRSGLRVIAMMARKFHEGGEDQRGETGPAKKKPVRGKKGIKTQVFRTLTSAGEKRVNWGVKGGEVEGLGRRVCADSCTLPDIPNERLFSSRTMTKEKETCGNQDEEPVGYL